MGLVQGKRVHQIRDVREKDPLERYLYYEITDGQFINYELVESGWAIPDDLAKKVSEVLNKFSITPMDELQDELDDMARDIALLEPDPLGCGWWQ